MQQASLSVLVLVGLVAVAGCNAFSGGWSPSTETPMVTPASVPTNEPGSHVTPQRVPCLSDSPVENISAFIANASPPAWDTTAFTLRESRTVMYRNGSLRSHRRFTGRVAANLSRLHLITVDIGSLPNLSRTQRYLDVDMIDPRQVSAVTPIRREIWTNSTQVVSRTTSGHTAHYYAGPPPYTSGHLPGATLLIREVLYGALHIPPNASACVTTQFTRNGTTLYRLTYTAPAASVSSNATGTTTGAALIDSRGVIHELRYDYSMRTADGTVVTVTERISITDIGSTPADRPLWYGIAVNRTQTNRTITGASPGPFSSGVVSSRVQAL